MFEGHCRFDCRRDTAADEDLAVLGGGAEPRREIADRPDRRVIDPLGEPDLSQRRVALRDADPEADLAPAPSPFRCRPATASRIATAIAAARSAGSGQGSGSLKNTMMPSPE